MKSVTTKRFALAGMLAVAITLALAGNTAAQTHAAADDTEALQSQARKVYEALRDLDFRAFYYLFAVTPKTKREMPSDPAVFAAQVNQGFESSTTDPEESARIKAMFHSIQDITIGTPVIDGEKAAVPTSSKITVNGTSLLFQGTANMIKVDGVWKLDLTYTDDVGAATEQQTSAILGKPAADQP